MLDLLAALLRGFRTRFPLHAHCVISGVVHGVVGALLRTAVAAQDDAGLNRAHLTLYYCFLEQVDDLL